jgi:DNA replication licensing factor MCM6
MDLNREVYDKIENDFGNFLLKFKVEGSDSLFYVEQAKNMRKLGSRTLLVDYQHMAAASAEELEFDTIDLQRVIQKHYLKVESALVKSVTAFMRSIDNETTIWAASVGSFSLGFYNTDEVASIRDCRTEHLGQLITICGTVTRTSDVKPELLVGTFECPDCGREIAGVEQQFKFTEPMSCPAAQCGWWTAPAATCGAARRWRRSWWARTGACWSE